MARRSRFIDSKSTTSLGSSLILNTNGVMDPRFAVSALLIKNTVSVDATSTAANLGAGDVGTTRIEALWESLNTPFLNNITYGTLDLWSARHWHPSATAYSVLADQGNPGGAAASYSFDFVVPVKRQNAARPADYCVALSEFGQITVQTPASIATGGFSSWTTEVYAIGDDTKPGEYIAGSLQRVDELTGDSGNVVDLRCYGHKVADLFGYTINSSSSPISGNTSARVEFDGREVVNFRGLDGSQLPYAWGNFKSVDSYATFVTAAGYGNTLVEDLVPSAYLQKISHMESVSTAQIFYNSRISSSTDQRYALTTLYPSQGGAQLAQRVPGGSAAGAAAIAAIASSPSATGGGAAGGSDSAYLPKIVAT